jgi:DNA repair protein RecN (Recombination protein N)
LGGKSDSSLVRSGSDRLVASAQFILPKTNSEISLIADESGADISEG